MPDYKVMKQSVNLFTDKIKDKRIKEMFLQCFYSTLKTTTEIETDGTAYVFTGDIPAMWLRDSSVQVSGYLQFCDVDKDCANLIKGVIARQLDYILIDPYANAFNKQANGRGHGDDITELYNSWVWERKYEIDSLCYPLWLMFNYYKLTGDKSIFDDKFLAAVDIILSLFKVAQNHDRDSKYIHSRPKYPQFPHLITAEKGILWLILA